MTAAPLLKVRQFSDKPYFQILSDDPQHRQHVATQWFQKAQLKHNKFRMLSKIKTTHFCLAKLTNLAKLGSLKQVDLRNAKRIPTKT